MRFRFFFLKSLLVKQNPMSSSVLFSKILILFSLRRLVLYFFSDDFNYDVLKLVGFGYPTFLYLSMQWVRWHPKGHLVLAGSEDYSTWMWNADLGKCLSVYTGHCESVTCGDFTPDGKTICTGSADGSLRIWNPQTQESKLTVKGYPYHTEGLTCLSISSDSTLVVSGSTDGSVHVVNIKNGKVVASLVGHSGSIECVRFSPSLTWVATGGMDKKLMIWELQSSSLRCTCQHEEGVMRLSWSLSSQHIITSSLDGIVRLWDSRSGVCERVFKGHNDSIQDMVVTVDQRFILTGSDDTTAKVFEIGAF